MIRIEETIGLPAARVLKPHSLSPMLWVLAIRVLAGAGALLPLCSCAARVASPKTLEELYEVQMEMLVDPELPEQDRLSIMYTLYKSEDRILWKVLIEHWDDFRVIDLEYGGGDHNQSPDHREVQRLGDYCSELFSELTCIDAYQTKEEMRAWWERSKDLPYEEILRRRLLESIQARWTDRWFLMTYEDKQVGWRHQTATRWVRAGQAGWTITEECENEIGEASHVHYVCKIQCLDDENLSPLKVEWSIVQRQNEEIKEFTQEIALGPNSASVKVISGFNEDLGLHAGEGLSVPIDREAGPPISCSILAPFLAEIQASTRIKSVTRRFFTQMDPKLFGECTTILEDEKVVDKSSYRVVRDAKGYDVEGYKLSAGSGLRSSWVYGLTLDLADADAAGKIEWRFKPESRAGGPK